MAEAPTTTVRWVRPTNDPGKPAMCFDERFNNKNAALKAVTGTKFSSIIRVPCPGTRMYVVTLKK